MYKLFLPDEYVKDIFHITPGKLLEKGVKGVITDLDNTLVEWDRPEATPEIIEWMLSMKNAGIKVMIVSNNKEFRVKSFCGPLGIPYLCQARKPLKKSFNKALTAIGFKREEVVMIGDQLMTDILGGNRSGLHTILVVPVAKSDGFVTKFNRMLERRIMAKLKSRGMITWED